MEQGARYFEDAGALGCFDVVFIAKNSGRKLVRSFDSPFLAKEFIRKLRRSKKCTLVSYPNV